QQRVHRDLAAGGMRDIVEAGGDLLRTAREFAPRQRLQHQKSNEAVTKQRDFFSLVVHRSSVFLLDSSVRRTAARFHANGVWGGSGGRRGGGECGAAAGGSQTDPPAQQEAAGTRQQATRSASAAR